MNAAAKQMIRGWLEMHKGDVEGLARWMSRTLKVAGIKECRAIIAEATNP